MSKIGLKLIAIFMAGLVVAILLLATIALLMSSNIIEGIVSNQNEASVRTLQGNVDQELENLSTSLHGMDALDLFLPGNEADLERIWATQQTSESEFLATFDSSGNVIWHSDNYELTDFDIQAALRGGWSGFVRDSKADICVEICVPITRNGAVIGAAVLGQEMKDEKWLDDIKALMGVDLALYSGSVRFNTTLLNADGSRSVGNQMAEGTQQTILINGQSFNTRANIGGTDFYIAYAPMYDINNNIIGAYCAGTPAADSDAQLGLFVIIVIIVSIVLAVIMLAVIIITNQKILIQPIKEANKIAESMKHGLFREPSPNFKFSNDELGEFVRNLESAKEDLNGYIGDINHVLAEMAVGDFTAEPKVNYQGDFAEVKHSFDQIQESLREIIGNIGESSIEVKNGSAQIAEGSHTLAEGTTQQAAATEEIAATINDIAEKVHQTAQNASEASDISNQSSDKITFQNQEVQNMLAAMDEIKEKSDQIQNIIKAIDDIAFQTNILALNAAIEAARAGAAGKGFAVVADEVRNLAGKSAESAQQTGDLINATIEAVHKGTVIAESTAKTMKEVTELSDRTNLYISDITAATVEQAEAINQIKIGIDRISQVVQENSATSEEIAASCHELSDQSANLESQIARFTV